MLGASSSSSSDTDDAPDLCLDGCASNGGWDQNAWYVQVDGVMGGRSSGELSFVDDGRTLEFSGNVDLRGGGFASVRRRFPTTVDLSTFAGVVATLVVDGGRARGDAPTAVQLRLGDATSSYGFGAALAVPLSDNKRETTTTTTTSVYLPLSAFDRGSRSGRSCSRCALNVSQIDSVDVYVLFQEGPFTVRLASVVAVRDAASFPAPPVAFVDDDDVADALRAAVNRGAFLYDKGYPDLCVAVYWSVLNTIVGATTTTTGGGASPSTSIRRTICAGLDEAVAAHDDDDHAGRAWTLRHTIDAVSSDLDGVARPLALDWLPDPSNAEPTEQRAKIVESGKENGGERAWCASRTSLADGVRRNDDERRNESVPLVDVEVAFRSIGSSIGFGSKLVAVTMMITGTVVTLL